MELLAQLEVFLSSFFSQFVFAIAVVLVVSSVESLKVQIRMFKKTEIQLKSMQQRLRIQTVVFILKCDVKLFTMIMSITIRQIEESKWFKQLILTMLHSNNSTLCHLKIIHNKSKASLVNHKFKGSLVNHRSQDSLGNQLKANLSTQWQHHTSTICNHNRSTTLMCQRTESDTFFLIKSQNFISF